MSSLQEISARLLLEAAGDDSVEAKEKVHVICNKLRLLLRRVAADINVLQRRLVRPAGTPSLYWSPITGSVLKTVCLLLQDRGSADSEVEAQGSALLQQQVCENKNESPPSGGMHAVTTCLFLQETFRLQKSNSGQPLTRR